MKDRLSFISAKLGRTSQRGLLILLHPLTVLLLAFTFNTLLWAAVTNLGNPPDEFSHFDYIRHLAINHTLPIYGETRYIHTSALQAHASLPPLYYLLGTPLQMALSNSNVTEQMLALRVLSVILGGITVTLVYKVGRLLAPSRPEFALAAATLVGFNPMFTYLCAAINSDNLINLIYAALFLVLAYGLQQPEPSRRWLIGLGVLLGAGLITKQTIVTGVLVSALVILFLAWRQRPGFSTRLIRYGFWVGGTAILVSGWFFVRNWILYGNPIGVVAGGRSDIFPTHPYRSFGSLAQMIVGARSDFLPFFPVVLRSFWGVFDHLEIGMPSTVYEVMTLLLVGGLFGAALWVVSSWRHRHDRLTGQRLLLAVVGCLILTLTFAALLALCFFIDNEPQGRYLFAALPPLSVAIVGGWEHLSGLLRLRWLGAPFIVLLVLTVNCVALICALAPAHHDRYLAKLVVDKQGQPGEGESYEKDNRYVPNVPLSPEPNLRAVHRTSPVQASFVAQQREIERLEMLLNIPAGARGPLIWRLGQALTDDVLTAVVQQPLAGPARYWINVASYHFTAGDAYTLRLEAPEITPRQPLLTTLTDTDAPGDQSSTDVRLQVVYPGLSKQTLLRADYLLRSDTPNSLRGWAQRLLYPLDSLLLLALAALTLAPLRIRPWRIAIVLAVLSLTMAFVFPISRASDVFLPNYEIPAGEAFSRPALDAASTAIYGGFHDLADCKLIGGWAWDANQPNSPVNVDIYDGDSVIATISANIFRPDLRVAGIGNGYHGFIYVLDDPLKNGQSHSIRVRFAGTNADLSNTPKSITCSREVR